MAITAATVWEIRTTGLNTNGGGFDNLSPGVSVDYSQQDTPILTRSDFQKGTGLNDITTAAGVACFTQAMIGNIICLLNTSVGFFQITTVSGDLKTITVDIAVGAFTGKTGSVGGAFKLGGVNDTRFFGSGSKANNNVIHIKAGTYTLTGNVQAQHILVFLGYNAARNDNPTGANRPVIDGASSYLGTSSYCFLHNLILTGSGSAAFSQTVGRCYGYKCKFLNTNAVESDRAACSTIVGIFEHCEFSSVKGTGFEGGRITANCCYFHDGNTGIVSEELNVQDCVFANLSVPATLPPAGINIFSADASLANISGCIFYACSNGILNTVGMCTGAVIVNNIFSCLTGITWYTTASTNINVFDYNCYFCSVADVVNLSKGSHDITADPLFMYPLTNDFRLSVGSPCFNTGMQLGSIVGL